MKYIDTGRAAEVSPWFFGRESSDGCPRLTVLTLQMPHARYVNAGISLAAQGFPVKILSVATFGKRAATHRSYGACFRSYVCLVYRADGNPQSLNLYAYVRDNPTTHADADGHCEIICVSIIVTVVGVVSYKIGQLYYHSKELQGVATSYKAEGALLNQVASNPNGNAESQVDLDDLARSIQSDEAKLNIKGSQLASEAVSLINHVRGASDSAGGSFPETSPPGGLAEKTIGAGVETGTKAVQSFVNTTNQLNQPTQPDQRSLVQHTQATHQLVHDPAPPTRKDPKPQDQ
jgi:hypothetical protein